MSTHLPNSMLRKAVVSHVKYLPAAYPLWFKLIASQRIPRTSRPIVSERPERQSQYILFAERPGVPVGPTNGNRHYQLSVTCR